MEVRGTISRVRESSFKGRSGETIAMVYFDVDDETASLVNCEMRADGTQLVRKMEIAASVGRLKKMQFGGGVSLVIPEGGLKVLSAPPAAPVPAPSFSAPEASHAPVGKK